MSIKDYVVGIDLGTTNSCIACYIDGEARVITNKEGARTTPSWVSFSSSGERFIGASAKRQASTNPKQTFFSTKSLIGRTLKEVDKSRYPYELTQGKDGSVWVKSKDKSYSPSQMGSFVLSYLKDSVESYLGGRVKKAVITVPAYFNDAQRQATKDAGEIAGLEVIRIINEPTAAALAYGMDKNHGHTIAVYDLGGGTFDISILEIGDSVIEVKATNGDTSLGGDDFDSRIIEYLNEEFKKENAGLSLLNDPVSLQRLKEAAEKAKIELSSVSSTDVSLPFITADSTGPKHLNKSLTRAKLESIVEDLIKKTLTPCKQAMEDAGIKKVDEVLLVGGMTRMPKVQSAVHEFFGKEPFKGINPDEVVALGAATQASILTGESKKDVLLLDVTPLSLGIETLGGAFTKLIEKNTTIPTKKSQTFSTAEDNQSSVTIKVLQGERSIAAKNKQLGLFDLSNIPPAPRGVPKIEVTFDIDANGIVEVRAKDLGTMNEQKISIEKSSVGLSKEEIDRMIKESEEMMEEDQKRKDFIDAKNNADSTVYSAEKSIREYGDKIEDSLKDEIRQKIQEVNKVIAENDIESTSTLNTLCEELSALTSKIGEAMYKNSENEAPNEGNTDSSCGDEKVVDSDYTEKKD